MQTIKFITIEERGAVCWCTTNDPKTFKDFSQYILDSCARPDDYIILDTSTNLSYKFMDVMKSYKMRKRTFDERMKDIHTGNMLIIH